MHLRHKNSCILFLVTICMVMQCYALPEDVHEKLFIEADNTIYNYKTGVRIFIGHVKLDQGTTHVTADRLVTKNNSLHKINEAIAYGETTPAHYWSIPKTGDKELNANAKIIKYYPLASNVVLEKNVIVTQGENTFQGELILYNMKDQIVTVPPTENAQAQLTYNPD